MKYCKRCVMPNTKKGIFFDDQDICSACRSNEIKRTIDWDVRKKELADICDSIRGSNGNGYDCIIPVSGGKDSIYQAWMMKEVYKMNVLTVCVAPHIPTSEGIANLNSLVTNMGVDLIKIMIKPQTIKALRRQAFLKRGEPNWAEHCSVFSGVARMAYMYQVPLVVWGEDIAVEFGGSTSKQQSASAEDLINNDLIKGNQIQDFFEEGMSDKDIYFYRHPDKDELARRKIKSIYLGYYYWWDGYKNYLKAREYGFTGRKAGPLSGNYLNYDNIDEKLCEINIWLKFIKFGFWRPTDQCCYQIWNDRMTREEAVKIVNDRQYEFPQEYFRDFLEFHEITESQFWETVEKFRNKDIWHKENGEWRLKTPLV